MPLHFLHIREGGDFIPDLEGIERGDLAAVERATIESANALIAEEVKRGRRDYRGRFEVEDE